MTQYTVSDIVRRLTDHQIEVLLRLSRGYMVQTSEGRDYRAWYVFNDSRVKGLTLRVDTVSLLHGMGLLRDVWGARWYTYEISEYAVRVLNAIDNKRIISITKKILQQDMDLAE